MQCFHPYYIVEESGPLAHHFTAKFSNGHIAHTYLLNGMEPELETVSMEVRPVEGPRDAIPPAPFTVPESMVITEKIVKDCVDRFYALDTDVVVKYDGYYRHFLVEEVVVMPSKPLPHDPLHTWNGTASATWNLCVFSDGTVRVRNMDSAQGELRGMEFPGVVLDYFNPMDFAPHNKETETEEQFTARVQALCDSMVHNTVDSGFAAAIIREPITLEEFNQRYHLRADVTTEDFEQ